MSVIGALYNLDKDSKEIIDIGFYGNKMIFDNKTYTIDTSNINHGQIVVITFTVKEDIALLIEVVLGSYTMD